MVLFFMQNGETALMWASHYGHIDIVKFLIEETQAQVNARNNVSQKMTDNVIDSLGIRQSQYKKYCEIMNLVCSSERTHCSDVSFS